jgi:HSP20 family protein
MASRGTPEERDRDTARGSSEAGSSSTPASRAGEHETGARVEQEREVQTSREAGRETGGGTGLARRPGALTTAWTASPFDLMRRFSDDLDRLFGSVGLGRLGVAPFAGLGRDLWAGMPEVEQVLWSPQVETFRRGDNLVVRADLPGLERDDVNVEVTDDNALTISGERRQEAVEDREGYYRSERSYGRFFRSIPLPEGVDADRVEASFKNGVLEVTLPAPKREERRGRKVNVR